jgi:hypothetical protein
MAIAPIGALEATLSSLATSAATQQQTIAAATPEGNRMVGAMQEKHEAAKAGAAERGDTAAQPGQQVAQASAGTSPAMAGQSSNPERTSNLEKGGPIVERQLFEYLAEAEKAGGMAFKGPSEMFGAAVNALKGPLQGMQKAFGDPASSAKAAAGQSPEQTTGAADNPTDPTTNEELLDKYISVMWAAANLELVTSSVTAATSSTNALVKQQ